MIRKKNEVFDDFKKRRKEENNKLKIQLKGKLFWDSFNWGTYIKKRDFKAALDYEDN